METERYIRITNLCMLFFRAEGIAFSLYDEQDACQLQYPEEPQRDPAPLFAQRDAARTLDICTSPSHASYASIRVKGGWRIVIGPVYNARLNESLVDAFMAENQIPAAQRRAAGTILEAAPNLSLLEFFDKAAYLYYCMDGEILDPAVYFDLTTDRDSFTVGRDAAESLLERKENEKFHNTYQWELMFYDLIRQGDPERLMAFLMQDGSTRLSRGTMAETPLRQSKNIFIGGITKIGMMAAVPAGLDPELTYQLIDSYVLDCERAATVPEIDRLQVSAALDFCRRIGELRLPAGISREVYTCMSYVRNHVNTPLSLDDVAAVIGRSVSYTGNLFKKETGKTLGNYITECRLEEAKSLLHYTDMTLAEISSYLCFSSQSYFQNVFKKEYGVTPMQYRRQHHTES